MTVGNYNEKLPVAPLKIIALDSCVALGQKVNDLLVEKRHEYIDSHLKSSMQAEYATENYLIDFITPRFGSGEGKGQINESVRGKDLYILCDVLNTSNQYKICGNENAMSPDDQYQNLKRVIAACNGKPKRITVIMPYLYEGRQHRRTKRESLDCALMLQELCSMGVQNIITFDAHDPRVQNAIPLKGFDNFFTSYQFIQAMLNKQPDIDFDRMMIVSPDEGGMGRSVYYSNILGVEMGMFYKRRDYSQIVNGKNPIVAHEFLGSDVEGKTIVVVDDMISSGESMLEVAAELKKRKAAKINLIATFGLFSDGLKKFDEYYEKGIFDMIYTTNLNYCASDLASRPYYCNVDLSRYIALIIHTLNHDTSVNEILIPDVRIREMVEEHKRSKTHHEPQNFFS